MADRREEIRKLILELGYERRKEPFRLSSGELSFDYVDAKRAIASGTNLRLVAEAILDQARVDFDAVGGLTMGADPLSHAISILTGKQWFAVRKEPKGHGKQQVIEGAVLTSGMRALVVDDVVTTGKSILHALDALEDLDVNVVLAVTIVDRGEAAKAALADRGIAYTPLLTYRDLNISPVDGRISA